MNFSRKSSITWKQKHWGDTRPVKPSAAFSGPVLFFPEKRVFFTGWGGGGGVGGYRRLISRTAVQPTHPPLSEVFSNTVKPSFTDTSLLRTLFFGPRESPYIFPKLNPLNTDTR